MKSEQFLEVLATYNHYQSSNLAVYWAPGTIPIALDRAVQAFSHAYQKGRRKRPKPTKEDHET